MIKGIKIAMAAALLGCAATASFASDAVSTDMLKSMGLAGMEVLSDEEAMTVRGKFLPPLPPLPPPNVVGAYLNNITPLSIAAGGSRAHTGNGNARTRNIYAAIGRKSAEGANSSAAQTDHYRRRVEIRNGRRNVTIRVRTNTYTAWGSSSASSRN